MSPVFFENWVLFREPRWTVARIYYSLSEMSGIPLMCFGCVLQLSKEPLGLLSCHVYGSILYSGLEHSPCWSVVETYDVFVISSFLSSCLLPMVKPCCWCILLISPGRHIVIPVWQLPVVLVTVVSMEDAYSVIWSSSYRSCETLCGYAVVIVTVVWPCVHI